MAMQMFLWIYFSRYPYHDDGPETAKDEIALWFEPKELVSYTSNAEKWIYGVN